MRAVATRLWGAPELGDRHVCIAGVGKVGSALADHLHAEGARLTVADVDEAAVAAVVARTGASVVAPDQAHTVACDLYAPCALGGALSAATIPALCCAAVVGSANNQLATPQDAQRIHDSGVLYAPDYVANAGGVINIAEERHGYDHARAEQRIAGIYATVLEVLDLAQGEGCTTAHAADLVAERRIDAARAARAAGIDGDLTTTGT
jgi:glutamate dehydrogenase/leucine dehydrogenase